MTSLRQRDSEALWLRVFVSVHRKVSPIITSCLSPKTYHVRYGYTRDIHVTRMDSQGRSDVHTVSVRIGILTLPFVRFLRAAGSQTNISELASRVAYVYVLSYIVATTYTVRSRLFI